MSWPDGLIVASQRKWVYKDFAAAAEGCQSACATPPIWHSHGFGVPNTHGRAQVAMWTSTAHAARLKDHMELPLIAPGPDFLTRHVSRHLLGRSVSTVTLGEAYLDRLVMSMREPHWVKLAEMKDDRLPAQRCQIRDFVMLARSFGAPDDTVLNICSENLPIWAEDRFFVRDGKVVTGAPYRIGQMIWDADDDRSKWPVSPDARLFAEYAVGMFRDQPRAYTLDIATLVEETPHSDLRDVSHVVLEVNPAWSSAVYGADAHEALHTVLASVDYSDEPAGWLWRPDPWLVQQAKLKVPLKYE